MDTVIAIGLLGFMYLVLPVAILILKDRLSDRRSRAAYEQALRERPETIYGTPEYAGRFDHPQFDRLQQRIAGPLPDSFRALHARRDLLRESGFAFVPPAPRDASDRWDIVQFLPADVGMLEECHSWLGAECLPFATDDAGIYYLDLAEGTSADAPVRLWVHDDTEREWVAGSLTELLSWRMVKWDEADEPEA